MCTCKDCKFCEVVTDEKDGVTRFLFAKCRINPPTTWDESYDAVWPYVKPDDWCGKGEGES